MNFRVRAAVAAALVVAAASSCEDATDIELLEIPATGVVAGTAYLDLNGSGSLDVGDTILAEVAVELSTGGQTIQSESTDTAGVFRFEDVPLGFYGIAVGAGVLGDTLEQVAADSIELEAGDTVQLVVGASFPSVTLEEALTSPVGLRIFTSGIALGPRVSFGDGQVHFRGASGFLRSLHTERVGILPGDSVRLRGRMIVDNGRPALDSANVQVLVPQAQLVTPSIGSTNFVSQADGGVIDGGLAQIDSAEITDTMTVNGDFHVWADDGSGPLEIVFRSFLTVDPDPFEPNATVRFQSARGLVSPYQDGAPVRWRLLPRALGDVVLETKAVDLSLGVAIDDTAAVGDTVAIDLAVTNNGPFVASSVVVFDTLPSGLSYLSSSATTGSYDSAEHRWEIGEMLAEATDSLQILAIVSTATLVPQVNNAYIEPLEREVETVPGDNSGSATLQLEAPRPVPCMTSTPVCTDRFEIADGVYLPAFTSHSIEDGDPSVTRALVMVHGSSRNAEDFFDTSVSAATSDGALGETLIIAPLFQTILDGPAQDEARWALDGWQRGDVSQPAGAEQVSSYDAMDRILELVSDGGLFPAIDEVVVAGHATGADLVHRIAALSEVEDQFPGVTFRYVPANAEAYLYTRRERDVAGTFQVPDTVACPTFDNWRYGLVNPNVYVGAVPADTARARLARRDVRLLLGDADTTRVDNTCGADLQGTTRLERGQFFQRFIDEFFASNGHVELVIPGVGHVQFDMFTSSTGRSALFGN